MQRENVRRTNGPPKLELIVPGRDGRGSDVGPPTLTTVLEEAREKSFRQAVIGTDGDVADDISSRVQEEIWEAIEKDPRLLNEPTEIEKLVFHVTSNRVRDWYRREQAAKSRQADIADYLKTGAPTWADPDATLSEKLLRGRIALVVAKFPAQMKLIWYLWFVELRATADIAEELRLAIKTVNNQLVRAKDRLKKALKRDGYGFFWRRKS